MKKLLALVGVVCLCAAGPAAEAKKRSAVHKPVARRAVGARAPGVKAGSRQTVAHTAGSRTTYASRSSRGRKAGARAPKIVAANYRRSGQQLPTSDRYREIQQALLAKGYYNGPVDGQWNGDAVSALQKFQKDQNLKPDGKLDSLSLIALGLGPKHEMTAQTRTP